MQTGCGREGRLSDWMAELSRQLPPAHFTQVGVKSVDSVEHADRVWPGGAAVSPDWMAEPIQQPSPAHFTQVGVETVESVELIQLPPPAQFTPPHTVCLPLLTHLLPPCLTPPTHSQPALKRLSTHASDITAGEVEALLKVRRGQGGLAYVGTIWRSGCTPHCWILLASPTTIMHALAH